MGKLVMIVDDDQMNRDLIETVLKRSGYATKTAFSGNQALSLIPNLKPDLILMDGRLGEPDGFEVCAQLKSDPATQAIPIIILTASNLKTDFQRAQEVGADDYYHKPDGWQGLIERVRRFIG
ncbi:MAG: response regulator [Anaerolineae bacterium]|nr:response regulator [Anaerolineae bacterium]